MNGHRDGTGIHKGLKNPRPLWLVGSNPTDGTKYKMEYSKSGIH